MENEKNIEPVKDQTKAQSNLLDDNLLNLAKNLKVNDQLKNNTMDLGSIMGLASTLLKNETVLNSLQGLGHKKSINNSPDTKEQSKQENSDLTMLKELMDQQQIQVMTELNALRVQIEKISMNITALNIELNEYKRTIQSLEDSLSTIEKIKKKKKK